MLSLVDLAGAAALMTDFPGSLWVTGRLSLNMTSCLPLGKVITVRIVHLKLPQDGHRSAIVSVEILAGEEEIGDASVTYVKIG